LTLADDERIELENIEILFDKKGKENTEAKNTLELQNYGFEKFIKWMEFWQIKSKPLISSRAVGRRCKELKLALQVI
jgi:hypothetical protein